VVSCIQWYNRIYIIFKPKEGPALKYIRQIAVIMLIASIGEALNHLIPLPVPASIYGIVIMLFLLTTGILKVESVKEVSAFLIEIMTITFIPATAGLIDSFHLLKGSLAAYIVILVVSTYAVMIVSGRVSQSVIRAEKESAKKEGGEIHE